MSEPVRYEVRVACPPDHAFRVFTERIDQWWPAAHRSLPGAALAFDPPGLGGCLVERPPEGEPVPLGRILAWDPPDHLAFSWRLGAPPGRFTRVDVRFTAEAAATRVAVCHTVADSGLGPDWPDRAARFADNWRRVLVPYVEMIGRPRP
ncbi:MAG: SRPBCC domain-containing protein [Myxococcota bacterium]